ncbi:MAG: amidohydrolase family protein [Candidatus Cloacimonadales bacterium]
MKLYADKIVFSSNNVKEKSSLVIESKVDSPQLQDIIFEKAIIYPALINTHDHLVGNWYPPAITEDKFVNSHIWVEAMKNHPTYLARNEYWKNDGSFILTKQKEITLCWLGVYKNIFSGVVAVQDHAPKQKPAYYQTFPVNVVEDFTQCHSLPLDNWWGGKSAEEEFEDAMGKMPFILHVGEGVDPLTAHEFTELKERGLLAKNTVMIHGICLSEKEIEEIAEVGATICWCPTSNENLIGKHLNIEYCLKQGVNVTLATDSTLSGGINLFAEMRFSKERFPRVTSVDIFKMVTCNAAQALMLPNQYGSLEKSTSELLILDEVIDNPFDNLIYAQTANIKLLLHDNKPILGDIDYFPLFSVDKQNYTTFKSGNREKFVIGDFRKHTDYINSFLTYHKKFPYLPE